MRKAKDILFQFLCFEFQHLDKKTEIFRFPDHLQHTELREIMLKNVKYLDLALF